jgi:hypothetical protein
MKLTADGSAKPGRNRSSSRRRALKHTKAPVTSASVNDSPRFQSRKLLQDIE